MSNYVKPGQNFVMRLRIFCGVEKKKKETAKILEAFPVSKANCCHKEGPNRNKRGIFARIYNPLR